MTNFSDIPSATVRFIDGEFAALFGDQSWDSVSRELAIIAHHEGRGAVCHLSRAQLHSSIGANALNAGAEDIEHWLPGVVCSPIDYVARNWYEQDQLVPLNAFGINLIRDIEMAAIEMRYQYALARLAASNAPIDALRAED
jgi:hypothetical protein